jgi:ABC-2 type transport system ATP-binding protein
MHALVINDLTKRYRNGVEALRGIDLEVSEGEFFALLGPDGAGKTTAIGIITSLVNKTGGSVSVFGYDLDRQRESVKACIGVVPQEVNLNMFERNFNTLVNQAGYYGVPLRIARERAEKYLRELHLWDKRDEIVSWSRSDGLVRAAFDELGWLWRELLTEDRPEYRRRLLLIGLQPDLTIEPATGFA